MKKTNTQKMSAFTAGIRYHTFKVGYTPYIN